VSKRRPKGISLSPISRSALILARLRDPVGGIAVPFDGLVTTLGTPKGRIRSPGRDRRIWHRVSFVGGTSCTSSIALSLIRGADRRRMV